MSSDVANVYVGAAANDGTGDPIRSAFQTVNSNFYNLDNRISTGNIAVIFATVGVAAQTFTSNSYTHTQTLEVYSTANIAGNAQVANLSVNNAFVASSVTSTANTSVQGGLTVTGPAQFGNNIVITGNLTVLGNTVSVNTADLAINDSLIQLHTSADLAPLILDDGKDIGIQFHYYKGADKHAALVWANDSQSLEFYADGVETIGNTFSGTYGNVKIGSLFATNTTATTNTTTGAIISRGGIAAAGNVASPNFLGNLYGTQANVANLSVSGQVVGSLNFTGTDTIYINGSAVATSAASFTGGVVPNYTLFNYVVETRGNLYANSQVASTSTTTGAIVVNGGVGIGGNLYVGGTFSVGSLNNTPIGNQVPSSGAFTTILANSTTDSTSVSSGAMVVKGGMGIAGNLYVGGSINNASIGVYGAAVGNFTTIGATTSGTGVFTTLRATSNLFANSGAISSNVFTGALVVLGGAGVAGTINANALVSTGTTLSEGVITANSATTSTNSTSGALVVTGGTGIGGNLNVAGFSKVSNSTNSTSSTTGALVVSGGVGIGGNLFIAGNLSLGGNILSSTFTSNSGSFIGDLTTGYGALYAGIPTGYTVLPSTPFQIATNANTYSQLNMQNINNGTNASSDYVVTAGNGTDSTYYGDFGIASNTYSYAGLSAIGPNDVYLLGVGNNANGPYTGNVGNVVISSSNGMIKLAAGGGDNANVIVKVTNTGIIPGANASYNLGSSTSWWNTIYGVANQAKYADLAENYVSDTPVGVGDVVVFGGEAEITTTSVHADTRVAGAISSNPAYLMNADCYQGQPVALRGRIPVNVIGKVAKGDLLVTSTTPGFAVSVGTDKTYGPAVFAKSLNDKDDDGQGQIEAVII
jgi:hypothetical protein